MIVGRAAAAQKNPSLASKEHRECASIVPRKDKSLAGSFLQWIAILTMSCARYRGYFVYLELATGLEPVTL